MSRWRSVLVGLLLLLPFLVYLAVGGWALWEKGWLTWLWLPLPLCWGLAFVLMRVWKRFIMPTEPKTDVPLHWTPRDQAAWKLVEERSRSIVQTPPEQLTVLQFYVDTATQLSLEIARLYHPKASDPLTQLTIPEILAAMELVFEDLSAMVDDYVPAGHLLTIKHWRHLSKIPQWTETFSKFYWPISAVLAPTTVLARYAASRFVVTPFTRDLQANVLAWFVTTFVQRVGFYAIEVNSGRLAGGAKKFRETMRRLERDTNPAAKPITPPIEPEIPELTDTGEDERTEVTIALVGQTKAGKSSLVNAILGEQKAVTDILPSTRKVTRYRLDLNETDDHLILLDTVGYATDGATEQQLNETKEALRQADLVLFVMNANSPAREPDRETLEALAEWYRSRPELKPTPVLGVLTHVDLLSPVMEWQPPYDWLVGSRPKERNIREAVAYNADQLDEYLVGVVPVCADVARNRVYGIEEFLLPAMTPLLGNARTCALLRSLHKEMSRDKVQRVVKQFWNVGKALVQAGLPGLERWTTRFKK